MQWNVFRSCSHTGFLLPAWPCFLLLQQKEHEVVERWVWPCNVLRLSLRPPSFFPGVELSNFLKPSSKVRGQAHAFSPSGSDPHRRQWSKSLLARALPWAFLNFILLQLWLPWIRILRLRTGPGLTLYLLPWCLLYLSFCSERVFMT